MTELRFGELLSQHRLAAGLTQEQLAGKSGLTAQAISALERGVRRSPRRHTVQVLADALGLGDPDRDDFVASVLARGPRRGGTGHGARTVRCLPPAVGDFTGRADHVERLRALLCPTASSATVVVSAIGGMGGVGKTALAVHVGHEVAETFPDGQLYVNLRGFGPGEPMTVSDALGVLLSSLGAGECPQQVDRAVARYRSALANKRVLVVLDNTSDEQQVELLLPNNPTCAAIVTSRRTLAALPGAHHVHLDVLTEAEAVDLLASIVGAERVAAAGEDILRRIVELCGRLPLALRIAGARVAARAHWPLRALADQLVDERRRLDLLEQRDTGVRASLAVSVAQLAQSSDPVERAAAAAVRRLGALAVHDLGVPTVARLIEKPRREAEQILDRLIDLHLIDEYTPGRFRMHDLVRTFAAELAHRDLTVVDHRAALVRVLRLHNTTGWRALQRSNPTHVRLTFMDSAWIDGDEESIPVETREAWLSEEWHNLVTLVEIAAQSRGVPIDLVTQVEMSSFHTFHPRGLWSQWMRIVEIAQQLAVESGDLIAEAFARYDYGGAQTELGHVRESRRNAEAALRLFGRAGSVAGEAMASTYLAHVLELLGEPEEGASYAHRALDLAEQGGHQHLAATACLALSMLYGNLGDLELEERYSRRSLDMFAAIGYRPGRARALYNLGVAQSRSGRSASALRLFVDAAEVCDAAGLTETGIRARVDAAELRLRQGKPELAAQLCFDALDIAEQSGCEVGEARARQMLGRTFVALGDSGRARAEWRLALVLYERLGAAAAAEVRSQLGSVAEPRVVRSAAAG